MKFLKDAFLFVGLFLLGVSVGISYVLHEVGSLQLNIEFIQMNRAIGIIGLLCLMIAFLAAAKSKREEERL